MSPITPAIFDDQTPTEAYKMPNESTSDSELLAIARAWEKESSEYHDYLAGIWKNNEDYYFGRQTDLDKIPSDMANTVQNQIFMGVETVIPIVTANSPQFLVEPPTESDMAIDFANATQKVLGVLYETKGVKTKGEMLMRHLIIYRYGCWKPYWDEEENDINVKFVRPKRLFFPKVTTELPYMMEQIDITSDEFKELWGNEKFKEFLVNRGERVNDDSLQKVNGIYTIWEIWTKDMVFWKSGGLIIDKKPNPYYDFVNKKANHFKNPRIPYIIASVFRLGNEPVGETDLITQTIPIQDEINVANRLILNNATKTGNAQWFIDNTVMSEEEAKTKITNSPGLIIYGSGVANPNMIRRDAPPPLPAYIENIKVGAERAFDNIFGTHSTTRGERQAEETLGGRMLLKQADIGRIDLIVREYERCVADLGNWFAQLMKIYYKSKKTFRYYGETGLNFVTFMSKMIQDGTRIIIKSGTTLPTDEISKRREAIELWSLAALDPETLYDRLKFPNPEETAKKLQAWRTGQLALEGQMKQGVQEQGQPTAQPQGRQVQPLPNAGAEIGRMAGRMGGGEMLGGQ